VHRARDLNKDTLADELGLPTDFDYMMDSNPSGEQASVKQFVKDQVMERPVKFQSHVKRDANFDHTKVEGHAVRSTSFQNVGKKEKEKDDEQDGGDELLPPMKVIKSLSELVSYAEETASLSASAEKVVAEIHEESKEATIETNMEFSYMSQEEYGVVLEEANSLGISVEAYMEQQKGDDESSTGNANGDSSFGDDADEDPMLFQSEDGDDAGSDDEVDDIFSFFGGSELDNAEIFPAPTIRPFMVLWNALSGWITPQAVSVVRKHKSELFNSAADLPITPESTTGPIQNAGMSDICDSRCAGLMNMLKMNFSKALSDLGYNSEDGYTLRIAETRLGEFIQCFDYSEPMVKFQSEMWRALTVILLNIVLPKHDIAHEGKAGGVMKDETLAGELPLPSSLAAIGMTMEEYKYLSSSAIPSLDVGSGNNA